MLAAFSNIPKQTALSTASSGRNSQLGLRWGSHLLFTFGFAFIVRVWARIYCSRLGSHLLFAFGLASHTCGSRLGSHLWFESMYQGPPLVAIQTRLK
jgi:hypothetical protein